MKKHTLKIANTLTAGMLLIVCLVFTACGNARTVTSAAQPQNTGNALMGEVAAVNGDTLTLNLVTMQPDEAPPEMPDGASFVEGAAPPDALPADASGMPGGAPPDGTQPAGAQQAPPDGSGMPGGQNGGQNGGMPRADFEITGESETVKISADTTILAMGSDEALGISDIQVGSMVAVTLAADGQTAQSVQIMNRGNGAQ